MVGGKKRRAHRKEKAEAGIVKKLVLSIICTSILSILSLGHVQAEGNTITVAPAQVDIELATTDIQKNASFTITNSYNVPVELTVELKGINQEAGLVIPGEEIDQSLAESVRLSQTQLIIPEQSTATLSMVVTNTKALSAGGHYGTIVFTQRKTGDSQVNFTQAISTGLFVVKRGGQLREVDATAFTLRKLPFQIPSSGEVTIKNIGNVHVIPRYVILVYGKDNTLVAKGVGDLDSKRILPDKELTEKVKIIQSRSLWLPERLKVVLEYRSDGIEESKRIEKSFLYIPPYTVVVIGLLFSVVVLLIRRGWRRRKRTSHIEKFGIAAETIIVASEPDDGVPLPPKITSNKKSKKRPKKSKKISVKALEP